MTQSKAASDYARKLAAAHAEAQAAGMKRWDYDTWADRLLRRVGFCAPPTLHAPLGWLWFLWAAYFIVAFVATSYFLTSYFLVPEDGMQIAPPLVGGIIGGALSGALMAAHQRYYRRKHRLSPWSAL